MSNVIHIMSGYGGGISSFIKNKAIALIDTNVVFDVITFDDCPKSFVETIEETGGKVYKITNPKEKGFYQFFKQMNLILKNKPKESLIHSHIQGYRALPFYIIAKFNKLNRFAIHAHTGYDDRNEKSINRKLTTYINRMISKEKISCGKKASVASFGLRYFERKEIMHIPNSIDEQVYFNEEILNINIDRLKRELYGETNKNKLIIGHVGRFHEVKNHYFILNLIEKLINVRTDFLMIFVGEGDLRQEIEKEVNNRQLSSYVKFLGRRDDLALLYKSFDFIILPSFYEGLPTVAIEAQAVGTRTLLSDSITKESDLGLGLVSFLPLNNVYKWIDSINSKELHEINNRYIKETIKGKKFTNDKSAQLYKNYVNKEITHYEI